MWPRSLAARTVGAGDVNLALSANRGVDTSEVRRALHAAIEMGLDLVDVSAEADSERLVGDAIRSLRVRERVLVTTRVPALRERAGKPTRDTVPERLPARYVQDRVEATLRATRLEVLPLAQIEARGAWRSSSAWPELTGACARLVREGKVLAWGALLETIEEDSAGLASDETFVSLSVPFSVCERDASPVLAAAAAHKRAVLARRPLAGSALAGSLGPGVKLRDRDERRAIDAAALEKIAVGIARLAAFTKREPPAARSSEAGKEQLERNARPDHLECQSVGELALRYVIDRGAIPLPRLHRIEHVSAALAAAIATPLTPELLARIEA